MTFRSETRASQRTRPMPVPFRLTEIGRAAEEGVAQKLTALVTCRPLHAAAYRILRSDSELMLLPVLHAAMAAMLLAAFAASLMSYESPVAALLHWATWVRGFAFLLLYDCLRAVFCGMTIAAATELFRGGDPTIRSAVMSLQRTVGNLLAWALLNGALRPVRAMAAISPRLRDYLERRLRVGWWSADAFAVPALVQEYCPLQEVVARSVQILSAFTGSKHRLQVVEPLTATVIRALAFLFAIGALFAWSFDDSLLVLITTAATAVTFAVATGLASASWAILLAAVYASATSGPVPEALNAANLQQLSGPSGLALASR